MSKLLQLLHCYFSIEENSLKLVVLLTFGLYLKLVEWPLKPIKSYWFSYLNSLCLFKGLFISPLKYFKSIWWRYHRTIKQGFCLFEDPILEILSSQLQTTLQCMMNAKLLVSRGFGTAPKMLVDEHVALAGTKHLVISLACIIDWRVVCCSM